MRVKPRREIRTGDKFGNKGQYLKPLHENKGGKVRVCRGHGLLDFQKPSSKTVACKRSSWPSVRTRRLRRQDTVEQVLQEAPGSD